MVIVDNIMFKSIGLTSLLYCLYACNPSTDTQKNPVGKPSIITDSASLTFIVHPYDNPSRLIARFSPLTSYLEEQLQKPVELVIARSYVDQIQRISNGQADLAYMGPTPYLRAQDHYLKQSGDKLIPIAAEVKQGVASYHSVIVVREDAPIADLNGLINKTLAFGAPHSFSSHYVPRIMIGNAGINFSHLKDFAFLGRHERVALSVLHGDFDAGGLNQQVAKQYQQRNPGLKIIATSPPLPPHLIIARPGFPEGTIHSLSHALLTPPADSKSYTPAMRALGEGTVFSSPDMTRFERARRVIAAVESNPTILPQW